MNGIKVTVLRCASCAGAVPFGDGDTLPCPYCAAPVEVPEEHRALRAAERQYNEHRSSARELLRRLGKPPSVVVRFLTRANGLTVVWLFVLGTLVSSALCAALFPLMGRLSLALFHVHLEDVVLYRYDPNALFMIGQFSFLLAFLGGLVVWGAYVHRRGVRLHGLQAGLSARAPERPGGPSTCRGCGAPLSAKAEELAVTCVYCRADNLLRIPESWIGAARDLAQELAGAIEDAARAFQDEERTIRRSLVVRLAVVAVVSASTLFLLIGVTDGASLDNWTVSPYQRLKGSFERFDWRKAVASPGLVLDEGDRRGCAGLGCSPWLNEIPCAERRKPGPLVIPAGACDEGACTMHWYVALRRGDAIEITASGLPPKTFIALKSHVRDAPFHTNPVAWGEQVPGGFVWLADETPARLEAAPHDGWFQLILGLGEAIPGTPLAFCARLERVGI
jgi:hypothetical protein